MWKLSLYGDWKSHFADSGKLTFKNPNSINTMNFGFINSLIKTQQRVRNVADIQCDVHSFLILTFRHRASCILGQAFHYSPENAFHIQGVTGGTGQTSGECSLGQTIPI